MRTINSEKLSKLMNDISIHRECVKHSGDYLIKYLISKDRGVDAIRLFARCQVHDMSKIENTEEFMALASIVDGMEQMHDIAHVATETEIDAKSLHWKNNSHHPEFYESPNDMSDLDLMEMACDCHARSKQYQTDLIAYIKTQQNLRFHFDDDHLRRLLKYCNVLVTLSKDDDYREIVKNGGNIVFEFKEETMLKLSEFNELTYPLTFETVRLYLRKEDTPDFASVGYGIYSKEDNQEVGYFSIKFNGYMEFKIYKNYVNYDYFGEVLNRFLDINPMRDLFIVVNRENECLASLLESFGFSKISEVSECSVTYRYRKEIKELKLKGEA